MKKILFTLACSLVLTACGSVNTENDRAKIEQMVRDQARAWETGDRALLEALLSDEVVFAYPGRRLDKAQTLEDLDYFVEHFEDTKVYIHTIVIDGSNVAVEWQFATTNKDTGARQVVSDAIIAQVENGQFTVWKEYLDGRVKTLQESGQLFLEEGEEPYPWPEKTELYVK